MIDGVNGALGARGSRFGRRLLAVLLVVGLLLGSALGSIYYVEVVRPARTRRDLVGVLTVEGPIISSGVASQYTDLIDRALRGEDVKAVVLKIDCPGGTATHIEQVYLDLLELGEEKPLVACITTALSGGYYISAAASHIVAHPISMVGSVGVIGMGPGTLVPSETYYETGAYKATGQSRLLFPHNLSRALDSFASAVQLGRGERLGLTDVQLRRAMVYLGSEAAEAGLVDELGGLQRAIGKAAAEAGLVKYDVVNLNQHFTQGNPAEPPQSTGEWRNLTVETLNAIHPPPAIYYLYLPQLTRTQNTVNEEEPPEPPTDVAEKGMVLVDLSHGNKVSAWDLDVLVAELAQRGVPLGFAKTWEKVEEALEHASALIVAAPTEPYAVEEAETIQGFLDGGRTLLLFHDPAVEYQEIPALQGPINTLANRHGLHFAKGYLYNEVEHYGLYRNIYVESFADGNLTRGLSAIVLLTAAHINTLDGVAWAQEGTISSTAERPGNYTTIAHKTCNGTLAAFGDVTFLQEPFCYLEDNYQLILNLVDVITGVKVPEPDEEEPPGGATETVTEPDLPPGTVKIFTETVNGEEQNLTWTRVSETETRYERPDRNSTYYYDEEGRLHSWESNGMTAAYDTPIPKYPYPLTQDKTWNFTSTYTITVNGDILPGNVEGRNEVTGFTVVEALDGLEYHCAQVSFRIEDELVKEGARINFVTTGHTWISSEAGVVREEITTTTYVEGSPVTEERRSLTLQSIEKGGEELIPALHMMHQ